MLLLLFNIVQKIILKIRHIRIDCVLVLFRFYGSLQTARVASPFILVLYSRMRPLGLPGVRYLAGLSGSLTLSGMKMIVMPDNACVNSSIFCATDSGTAISVVPKYESVRKLSSNLPLRDSSYREFVV